MKKHLKLLTIIVVALAMMVGINVKAEDMYSDDAMIRITIPIHKTDSNKKGLEGAIFTLKDFNNTISYSSSDKKDGDYLIEINKQPIYGSTRRVDQEYRIEDHTSDDDVLTEILDVIPTKYSDVFRKAESKEDIFDILDLPVYHIGSYTNYLSVGFYVPLKVEETKVPTGYKAKNIVIPAFVYLGIDTYNDEIYVYSTMSFTPGYGNYNPFEAIPAYFEYKDGTDYEAIFDKINNKLDDINSEEALYKLFEDNGAIVDDDCELIINPTSTPNVVIPTGTPNITLSMNLSREDFEERFDEEIEEYLCPINLVDEKEDIKVNPETYGTLALILVLIGGATGFILIRKNKKEA